MLFKLRTNQFQEPSLKLQAIKVALTEANMSAFQTKGTVKIDTANIQVAVDKLNAFSN